MSLDESFSNRHYAILGGSGGIGSEIARRLSQHNAQLHLASRDTSSYGNQDFASGATVTRVDAKQPGEIEDWLKETSPERGFDGVINAVGSIDLKPIGRTSYDTWNRTIQLNLTSCFALARGYVDCLPDEGGSFLAFSSAAAGKGFPNHGAISAAKAGVEGLIRSLAATYSSRNLRANCISPRLVETPLSEDMLKSDRARQQSESMHALGRLGQPEDPARAAIWLLNPDNDWVTGQVIGVDGGLRAIQSS